MTIPHHTEQRMLFPKVTITPGLPTVFLSRSHFGFKVFQAPTLLCQVEETDLRKDLLGSVIRRFDVVNLGIDRLSFSETATSTP